MQHPASATELSTRNLSFHWKTIRPKFAKVTLNLWVPRLEKLQRGKCWAPALWKSGSFEGSHPLYEGWFLALYNVFYTAYPVLCMGLMEQDVSAEKSLQLPELYKVGQKDELFNYRVFCVTFLHGTVTSLGSFYIALWAFEDRVGSRVVGDYQSFAVTVATSAFLSVVAEIIMDIKFWTILTFLTIAGSLIFFCLFSFLTQNFPAFREAPTIFRFLGKAPPRDPMVEGLASGSLPLPTPDPFILSPPLSSPCSAVSESTVELKSHFRRGSLHRRSSYAFSHKEGYADLIARGASLRVKDSRSRGPVNAGSYQSIPLPTREGAASSPSRSIPLPAFLQSNSDTWWPLVLFAGVNYLWIFPLDPSLLFQDKVTTSCQLLCQGGVRVSGQEDSALSNTDVSGKDHSCADQLSLYTLCSELSSLGRSTQSGRMVASFCPKAHLSSSLTQPRCCNELARACVHSCPLLDGLGIAPTVGHRPYTVNRDSY
uniref:P-type ATPase C-terminal domain-containing protein n=1 Tax=Gopherus evgoodei TaxID=1825980 RepID=A0A8C4WMW5_9SAUR